MAPICQRSEFSAAAAVCWACGTIRAIRESSAGRWSPASADTPPATTYSGHNSGSGSRAFTSRIAASTPSPASVSRMTRRRSTESASAPPYSPKTTSGTSSTAPIAPTASGEPVRSLIWSGSAMSAMKLPKYVIRPWTHSSRKSAEERHGERSGSRARNRADSGEEGAGEGGGEGGAEVTKGHDPYCRAFRASRYSVAPAGPCDRARRPPPTTSSPERRAAR